MSEILNANPTIRSAADLPSRRREPTKKIKTQRPFGLLSSTIPDSAYNPDPFNPSSSSESESSDNDEEVETIDEQEIYGHEEKLRARWKTVRAWLETLIPSASHPKTEPVAEQAEVQASLKLDYSMDYQFCSGRSFIRKTSIGQVILQEPPRWADLHDEMFPHREIRLSIPEHHLIAPIQDPEHPLTLGSLSVVNLPDITLSSTLPPTSLSNPSLLPAITTVTVLVTPTITHCSLATVIGLGVRVRLEQALPPRFRVDVRIKEGTHSTAEQVNRQLGDKERVAAALENGTLMGVLRKMLEGC